MFSFLYRRALWLPLAALIVISVLLAGFAAYLLPTGAQRASSTRALIGGPFALTDHQGRKVTEATYAGRYMLVNFGYTFCPDICPMGLQTMMAAYDELPAEAQDALVPLFITVDPARDTVDAMADYVQAFHPALIGLTGTEAEADRAAQAYRVYHAKAPDAGDGGDYLVDHSAFFYLMGPDGAYLRHFGHDTPPETMAADILASMEQ